jgi:hypothetical protein
MGELRLARRDLSDLAIAAGDRGTGLAGEPMGTVAGHRPFVYDPFDAYRAGLVDNPNIAVLGDVGTGKSTFVKMLVRRASERHRRVVVLDPKGEYGGTAGGWWDACSPWSPAGAEYVAMVLGVVRGDRLTDDEYMAVRDAWHDVVTREAPRPFVAAARHLLAQPGLRGTVRRCLDGDAAAVVNGEGDARRVTDALSVVDLSAYWNGPLMPLVMVAATSVAHTQLYDPAVPGYLVLDESWAVLQSATATHWLRGSWKLSRAVGVSHIVVLHRVADLAIESPAALSVLRDCDTHVIHRQRDDDVRELRHVVDLSPRDARTIHALPRGSALVHYGSSRSVVTWRPVSGVDHTDTDGAMRAN